MGLKFQVLETISMKETPCYRKANSKGMANLYSF
jgi:hypothetical protein